MNDPLRYSQKQTVDWSSAKTSLFISYLIHTVRIQILNPFMTFKINEKKYPKISNLKCDLFRNY